MPLSPQRAALVLVTDPGRCFSWHACPIRKQSLCDIRQARVAIRAEISPNAFPSQATLNPGMEFADGDIAD